MKRTNHYQVVISDTSADDGKITPTWTKVSATPWKGKATHHGGYGRRCIVMLLYEFYNALILYSSL